MLYDLTRHVTEIHPEKMIRVLDILLPGLAPRVIQRYQFGIPPDPNALDQNNHMDRAKLSKAPINNLDPERRMGFSQYELKPKDCK